MIDMKLTAAVLLAAAALFSGAVPDTVQAAEPELTDRSPALTAAERSEVVTALAQQLRKNYVFPDVAEKVIAAVNANAAAGHYKDAPSARAFAKLLTVDMREVGHDAHFRVEYQPDFVAQPVDDAVPSDAEAAKMQKIVADRSGGIRQVHRLPGNVAYIEMMAFFPVEHAASWFDAALALSANSNALILDLRRNGGGDPNMVAYVMSHFFAIGDERHLNDLYFRPKDQTREFWTTGAVTQRYLKPVYVLVSGGTFSGAEECAYDFQTQKRATLIGATTGGGANPGDYEPLGHGLVAFVPDGRAINPITHTNWEHVGVKPDIEVPATDALTRAYVDALEKRLAGETDADAREYVTGVLEQAKKGEIDPAEYRVRPAASTTN